ncbi:MAG: preprotein translocase subunit SecG [Candidatus Omnitrophica bacterium]|nr:preprotein translocase subunit SecG [Candidatus Omnitrophota bacterium]
MTGLIIALHVIICALLATIILMQSGRGGGLTEAFASAESVFGAKTNEMLIKVTTILASLFLLTCLGLAVLSSQKGKSIMTEQAIKKVTAENKGTEGVVDTKAVAKEEAKVEIPSTAEPLKAPEVPAVK